MTRTKAGFICGAFINVLMHANRCFCHVTCSQAHTSSSQEFIDISHEAEEEISKKRCGSPDLISANIFPSLDLWKPITPTPLDSSPSYCFQILFKIKANSYSCCARDRNGIEEEEEKVYWSIFNKSHSFIHSFVVIIDSWGDAEETTWKEQVNKRDGMSAYTKRSVFVNFCFRLGWKIQIPISRYLIISQQILCVICFARLNNISMFVVVINAFQAFLTANIRKK